jgi:hypothetical protein
LLSCSNAALADLIDQSYIESNDSVGFIGSGGSDNLERAQTFTVGLTGQLTRVKVAVTRGVETVDLPLFVDIREVSSGVPTDPNSGANVLGTVEVPAATFPVYPTPFPGPPIVPQALIEVDFSSFDIDVTAGEVLAIALRTNHSLDRAYQWDTVQASTYPGGAAFRRFNNGGSWTVQETNDYRFQTFVNVVPEPTGLLLIIAGMLFAVGAGCRTRGE